MCIFGELCGLKSQNQHFWRVLRTTQPNIPPRDHFMTRQQQKYSNFHLNKTCLECPTYRMSNQRQKREKRQTKTIENSLLVY